MRTLMTVLTFLVSGVTLAVCLFAARANSERRMREWFKQRDPDFDDHERLP
jgi:hypothetical protein